jgi:ligand-binding sensor domain-containing protein
LLILTHKHIFLSIALLLSFFTKAQQYFFKNFTPESGLLSVQISCLYQDRNGYLWAGGYGGLTRFDGKNFMNFSPKNGLIEHNVSSITGDDEGNVYVGTSKGLSVINGLKIQNYDTKAGLSNINITSLCNGEANEILIGTEKGLFRFNEGKITNYEILRDQRISCLHRAQNKTYVGTNKGLYILLGNGSELFDSRTGLASDQVNCVVEKGDKILIGTTKGLSIYNSKTNKFSNYYIENGLIAENVTSLINQNDEYVWIGSDNGLLRFDWKEFKYYNIGYDNNSNVVKCILQDREDNIWFGTHSGIFMYRDNSFSTFDKVNGPGNAFIFQIFRDKNQNLWTCSDNNGLFKYSGGYFKRYGVKEGLQTNVIRTGIQDKEGRLLFGTKNGIVQFQNEKFSKIDLPKEFKGSYEMIFQKSDSSTWIIGSNGIVSLRWKGGKPITHYDSLPVNIPYQGYALCEDDEKALWIGTSPAGLFKKVGDKITHVSKEMKLAEENYYALRSYKEYILSATLNGLFILNTKTGDSKYVTEDDGLNSELVYSIEFAENKKVLWIGTNQGINKFNLEKYFNNGIIEITAFGKQQGFMGVECNSNGIWEDKDGSLWFGTVSGLIKHEPFNLKHNTVLNTTLIQKIKLFSEDTLLEEGTKLPSSYNTISFYYRGICLTNPERVMYMKKLDGLEKEWSTPSSEEYCKYANLAPGTYTFMVKSCNSEGLWGQQPTLFTFTILRPFYTTWWFLLLVIGCCTGTILTVVNYRIAKIKKKQKEELDRKVEISKIELKALRSQMNPHFIFNSLNSIQHYIFNTKSDEAIKYLSKFARLVRTILNNSNKPTVTVGEDLEALKLYLELEQMRFEEKFDYEILVDPSVDSDYDIMPPLLIQPYVENAILHGLNTKPGKGMLKIAFRSDNNYLICTIEDNGIGREKASEIKRTMPKSKHKSLGMKITEDRLKILNDVNNSQLSVTITDLKDENGNALGTKVELFIPILG